MKKSKRAKCGRVPSGDCPLCETELEDLTENLTGSLDAFHEIIASYRVEISEERLKNAILDLIENVEV